MFTLLRPCKREINQHFGENPQNYLRYGFAGHEGVDFLCPPGDPVHACADGTVIEVVNQGNYGLHIRLESTLDGWHVTTIYCHLSQAFVWKGKSVKAGELIALSGDTGHSGGPHLHLTCEVQGMSTVGYPDNIVDPEPFFVKA
jgi:murein DD-endopeptidase MepM/ murein hydrolase activator NlpD